MAFRKSAKMNDNPLISVIVPVYNVEQYLKQCVNSIRNQTYRNIEIILVDDGSPDNCGELCDQFKQKDCRIKVLHQENAGVSVARNNGMTIAGGKYIAFVDGDDYIEDTMYEKMLSAIGNRPIVFSRFSYEYDGKTQYRFESNLELLIERPYDYKYYTDEKKNQVVDSKLICDRVFGSVCRSLFLRNIIVNHKITFSTGLKIAEDRLFLMEYLLYCERAAIVDEYLYHYRMTNSASATSTTFGKYNPELEKRSKYLAIRQTELVKRNNNLRNKEKEHFIIKLQLAAVNEVVQNEIRFNEDYANNLNRIFGDIFFSNAITFKSLLLACKEMGAKKAIYFYLIKCHMWSIIAKHI